jgi:hypothetical protein
MSKEITIIGAGNMGQAVARGLLERNIIVASNITLSNPNLAKLSVLRDLGVKLESNNSLAIKDSETLILAVKPQMMTSVLNEICDDVTDDQLVISLAAGISLNTIRQNLLHRQAVVRVMPNLGAQESAPKFIADMKETGLIYDYNWESTTIFVDPYKWNNLTIDQKEKAGAIFAAYFEYRTGNAFANIKDKYSGHKLNSYVWGWGLE